MDNNVQNIRSGRALAGFGKFFSGLGRVIAAIGAILGGAVPVIIVGVVLLIIGGLMSSASGKKLQGAAQGFQQGDQFQGIPPVCLVLPAVQIAALRGLPFRFADQPHTAESLHGA